MSYQVVWTRRAEGELATIWTDAPDRDAVSHAARRIDAELAHDPQNCGESRAAGRRIFFMDPLVITFRILEADRLVRVLGVRRYAKMGLQWFRGFPSTKSSTARSKRISNPSRG